MSLGIAFENINYKKLNIPTRFDDIQNEIVREKMKNSVEAYKKYVNQTESQIETYKLGDILGEKLNEII